MVEISKAEIKEQDYSKDLRKNTKHNLRGNFMSDLRGTENLQIVVSGMLEILTLAKDKFADGFQITDIGIAVSLYSPIKDIADAWEEAEMEVMDLTPNELRANTEFIADGIMDAFGVDISDTGDYGIREIEFVLKRIGDIVELINEALSDGMQWEDLKETPTLLAYIIDIALAMKEAITESKDLSGKEISIVASSLAYRIHSILLKV